jgi:hypothetical protein
MPVGTGPERTERLPAAVHYFRLPRIFLPL